MTVAELIEKLQTFPPTDNVYFGDGPQLFPVHHAQPIRLNSVRTVRMAVELLARPKA